MRVGRRRHFGRHFPLCAYQTVGGSDNHVYAYKRAPDTNLLTQIQALTLSGVGFDLECSADGKYVYVADSVANQIAAFSRNTDGTLNALGTISSGGATPWGIASTPDNQFVYAVNNTSPQNISMYARNSDGTLTSLGINTQLTLNNPKEAIVSPDGRHLYVTNQGSSTIAIYAIGGDGTLVGLTTIATNLNGARCPIVSPDGAHVYCVNQGGNTIAEFTRNSDGTLTAIGAVATGVSPRGCIVSKDGFFVYVANTTDSTISIFRRNVSTGVLTASNPATIAATGGPITIANDRGVVYTAGGIDVFARNADGSLSKQTTQGNPGFYLAISPPA